jgi:ribonuclease E
LVPDDTTPDTTPDTIPDTIPDLGSPDLGSPDTDLGSSPDPAPPPETERVSDAEPTSAADEEPAPATRRRRAASRPAGPPEPAFTSPDQAGVPGAPAASGGTVVAQTVAAQTVAAQTIAAQTIAAQTIAAPLFQAPEPAESAPPRRDTSDAASSDNESAQGDGGEPSVDTSDDENADEAEGTAPRRRRRRGGRGRRKADADEVAEETPESADQSEPAGEATTDETAPAEPEEQTTADTGSGTGTDAGTESEGSTSSRRRRRRRRGSGGGDEAGRSDEPSDTVVRVRESRRADDQITATRGSTRMEAKRQRRRDGRDTGRRRPTIMSESEFLARRESVERIMVVRQRGDRDNPLTQLAVLEDGMLVEHYVDQGTQRSIIGNIYLGKVQNVLPAMEAAFVDIGRGRNAVLYAGEVDWSLSEGKPKRIEEALTSGQSVLVQVTKDPIGHKGARLTSSISLPGRFVVYVPGGSMSGISRKLSDTERSRLRSILKDVVPDDAEVIIRTAAEGAGEEELRRDVARLKAQWEDIEAKVASGSAPATLYAEPDLTLKIVRDLFNEDFAALVVSGDDAWDTIEPYVSFVAPTLVDRLQRWDSDQDVFDHYRVDEQIAKALERKVWLPSGGSLVIDRTEAMTVIDVNTGKFTGGGGNLEETVTKNNLEAAEEVARQLRLRDIGGIIVVDFIDMVLGSNRDLVLRRLVECLARDRTRHQVAEVTSLGLVQMTRKRIGTGLLETFSKPCECCGGRGVVTTTEPVPVPQGSSRENARRAPAKRRGGAGKSSKHTDDVGTRREQSTQDAAPEHAAPEDAAPEHAPSSEDQAPAAV